LATGQTKTTLHGHTSWVTAVVVTPDGRHAVSGSADHTLRVWDLESGKEIAAFTGVSDLSSCAIASDGRTIIAGESSGRLHFLRLVQVDETKPAAPEVKISPPLREMHSADKPKEDGRWRFWKKLWGRTTPTERAPDEKSLWHVCPEISRRRGRRERSRQWAPHNARNGLLCQGCLFFVQQLRIRQ
jgi:WD40 repeat protein